MGQEPAEANSITDSAFSQILNIKAVHFLAFFALIYIGVEVTVGGLYHLLPRVPEIKISLCFVGWIVTFIIRERGGGHSAGYISSGFFGGRTNDRTSGAPHSSYYIFLAQV